MNIKCSQCIFNQGGRCPVINREISNEDFCSFGTKSAIKCDICGNALISTKHLIVQEINGKWIQYCGNCAQQMGHCSLCDHTKECKFETDPDQMPKLIQKQIQQGPYQAVTTIRNPDRIRKFCQDCICSYGENFECLRQTNTGCDQFILKGV